MNINTKSLIVKKFSIMYFLRRLKQNRLIAFLDLPRDIP